MRRRRFAVPVPPLAVDFSPRRRWLGGSSLAGVALLVAGVLMAAAAGVEAGDREARVDAADERVAALRKALKRQSRQAQVATAASASADAGRMPAAEELTAARRIAGAVSAPWPALLRELESAGAREVALLAVEADTATRSLRLSGEAASADDAFAYAARLGESDHFDEVAIVSHEEKQLGARTIFAFTLAIVWSER